MKKLSVILVLAAFLLILSSCSTSNQPEITLKTLKLGEVPLASVPSDAQIEWQDSAITPRVKELYTNNKLKVFDGMNSYAKLYRDEGYDGAKKDALSDISEFVKVIVNTYSQRIQTSYSSGNSAATSDVMKTVEQAMSANSLSGAKVIMKYYIERKKGSGFLEYHTLVLFDPEQVAMSTQQVLETPETLQKIQNLGIETKTFFKNLNDIISDATKGTPMENK